MAGVTWLYAQGDGASAVQTQTAASLSFFAGDRIVVWGFAMSNGNGDVYSPAVTDTASTNNPTWTSLATCATNTTSSSAFCTKLVSFVSDALIANETFDITFDPQSGSANTYFISMGVGRLTSVSTLVQVSTDIGTNFNDLSATCTPSGAATVGNIVLMVIAASSTAAVIYDTPPTNFALISGANFGPTGNFHGNAISSITTSASSFTWGFSSSGGDYNLAAFTAEFLDGSPTAVLSQSHFRFGADDAVEASHSFIAAEDANVNLAISDARLLRIQVDETGGAASTLTSPTWQYKQVGDPDSEFRDIKP